MWKSVESSERRPGVRVNDIVRVNEIDVPWNIGTWTGKVIELYDGGDLRVVPIETPDEGNYSVRIRASEDYLKGGLYLTERDSVEKLPVSEEFIRLEHIERRIKWLALAQATMTPEAYEEGSKELLRERDELEKKAKDSAKK